MLAYKFLPLSMFAVNDLFIISKIDGWFPSGKPSNSQFGHCFNCCFGYFASLSEVVFDKNLLLAAASTPSAVSLSLDTAMAGTICHLLFGTKV